MENTEVKTDCKGSDNLCSSKPYDIHAYDREQEQQRMLRVRALEEANKTYDITGEKHTSESLVKSAKEIYEFLKGE